MTTHSLMELIGVISSRATPKTPICENCDHLQEDHRKRDNACPSIVGGFSEAHCFTAPETPTAGPMAEQVAYVMASGDYIDPADYERLASQLAQAQEWLSNRTLNTAYEATQKLEAAEAELAKLREEKAELERKLFAMIENKWTIAPTPSGVAYVIRGDAVIASGEDPIDALTAALAKHAPTVDPRPTE